MTMKIMLIVLNEDDGKKIANELEMDDYKVTRLKSLGGFIKDGQIAIMLALEEYQIKIALKTVKDNLDNSNEKIELDNICTCTLNRLTVDQAAIFILDPDKLILI